MTMLDIRHSIIVFQVNLKPGSTVLKLVTKAFDFIWSCIGYALLETHCKVSLFNALAFQDYPRDWFLSCFT